MRLSRQRVFEKLTSSLKVTLKATIQLGDVSRRRIFPQSNVRTKCLGPVCGVCGHERRHVCLKNHLTTSACQWLRQLRRITLSSMAVRSVTVWIQRLVMRPSSIFPPPPSTGYSAETCFLHGYWSTSMSTGFSVFDLGQVSRNSRVTMILRRKISFPFESRIR